LRIAGDSGLFDIEECAEVEHDPLNHTLRQVGLRSGTVIQQSSNNVHYDVRLRSRLL